jgi:CubicO group peptidase (beta-lactamase class C family)
MNRSIGRVRLALVLGALLSVGAASLAQQAADDRDDPTPPAGRRGERIRQVLDAVNSGEPARIEALVKEAFGGPFREIPSEDHLEALLGLFDRSQHLDFHGVRRYTPPGPADREVVIARNRLTGGWQGITLSFDGTPEARVTGIQILPARPPKGLPPPPPLAAAQAKDELDAFLDRLAAAGAFSGTALLAKDGRVVYEAARGVADRNHGVPMSVDSKLNLGSMNKMFTATVIGQLADEGKLSFQDPVSKFLGGKGWTKADLSKVRVEHLLSHTSGLGNYFNDTYRRTARQLLRKVDDYKPLVADETLAFEPGTRWRANTFQHVIRGGPAGGGYSTVRDLLAFAEAVRSGRLVSPATAERLWTPRPDLGSPEYGFGFGVGRDAALGRSAGHSGGFSGISSILDIYLDSGRTVAVLSNVDGGMPPVAQKLREVAGRIR